MNDELAMKVYGIRGSSWPLFQRAVVCGLDVSRSESHNCTLLVQNHLSISKSPNLGGR